MRKHNESSNNESNIESWCQKVLDLLDFSFAEPLTWMMVLCYLLQYISQTFQYFLQMREEIGGHRWTIHETVGFLWNMPDISRGSTQAKLTQRQRKFELFNPSQAKLEEQHI